jgi:Flp pilus assembly protein TadD
LHVPRLLPWFTIGAVLLTLLSCSGSRRSTLPVATAVAGEVRVEVDRAERAELTRDHAGARHHYEAAVRQAVALGDGISERFARREYAETLITWAELSTAAVQFERIVVLAPQDASSWHDLGQIEPAIAALTTARRLAPRDARPRISLAALHWRRGDLEAARHEYQGLLDLDLAERTRSKVEWAIAQLEVALRPGPQRKPRNR